MKSKEELIREIESLRSDLNTPGLLEDEKQFLLDEIAELENELLKLETKNSDSSVPPVKRKRGRPKKSDSSDSSQTKTKKKGKRGRPKKEKKKLTAFEKKLEACKELIRKHRESKPRKEPVRRTRPKRLSELMAKVFNIIAEANYDKPEILEKAQKDVNDFYEKISREYLGTEKPLSPETKEKMDKKIDNAAA
jgi:hypothetical protein